MCAWIDHLHQPVIERLRISAPSIIALLGKDLDPLRTQQLHERDKQCGRPGTSFQVEVDDLHSVAYSYQRQAQQRARLPIARFTKHDNMSHQFLVWYTQLVSIDPCGQISSQKLAKGFKWECRSMRRGRGRYDRVLGCASGY